MRDKKYLDSLEKFIQEKVQDCEVKAIQDTRELTKLDLSEYALIIVSSLLQEGVWLKALPVIRKVQNFILLALKDGPELNESVARKYGAKGFLKLPINSEKLLFMINDILEDVKNGANVPKIITRKFIENITEFFEKMDEKNYYELFELKPDCSNADIKKKYIGLARTYHPDKFRNVPSEIAKMAYEITKRVNEAYSVLSHPNRRCIFDRMLRENPEMNRFDFRMKVAYNQNPEDTIENPQARRFALLAKKAIDSGDYKSALTQLKMASTMEKDNSYLEQLIEEAKKALEG
jgi:hypothetical protein